MIIIRKKTPEVFRKEFYEIYDPTEYKLLSDYTISRNPVKVEHATCGTIYYPTANNLLKSKSKCPQCYGNIPVSVEDFSMYIDKTEPGDYEILGLDVNSLRRKFLIKHVQCGHEYSVRFFKFKSGQRCPSCKMSKGEVRVRKFLEANEISFKSEQIIPGCKRVAPLRFDFVVGELDNPRLVIEYDGEQHFEPKARFGGELGFRLTVERDEIKNAFCEENEIPILRIPYYEIDNIEEILTDKLLRQEAS